MGMNISSASLLSSVQISTALYGTPADRNAAGATPDTLQAPQDTYTQSRQATSAWTYSNPSPYSTDNTQLTTDAGAGTSPPSAADLASMLQEANQKAQAVMALITPMIKQQGLSMADIASGRQHLTADPATIAAAQAAIAPDGPLGVRQVSATILNFAKAAIGNDPSKFDVIRAAVEKGFSEAQQALGGVLPAISQQTIQVVRNQFDLWAKDMSAGTASTDGNAGDQTTATDPAATVAA